MSEQQAAVAPPPIEVPIHMRQYATPQAGGGSKIRFVNPNSDNYDGNIRNAASLGLPMHKKDMFKSHPDEQGPTVIVAGSGPSLRDPEVLEGVRRYVDEGAIIFACKAAIKFLHDEGFKVDWGVSMDPGAHIAQPDKIFKAPGTKHLIASSSDPALFEYLKDEEVWLFHSATGYEKEVELYNTLFDVHECMGGGYNVVNRAVSAALFMGAGRVVLAGCDCGWRDEQKFYVDGKDQRPGVDMEDHGIVEADANGTPGRKWNTRPDMLASGVALAKLAKKLGSDHMVILGDTLPSKLVLKDDEFLQSCASFQ